MMLLHPSSVGNIIGTAASVPNDAPAHILAIKRKTKRSDEEKAIFEAYKESILSEGAKTYLNQIAKEQVYGFREVIDTKPMKKGILCEQESIDLYNRLFFTFHTKNGERRKNDILTGEADIVADDRIIDIKTSWSMATFPATPDEAHSDLYEWQGRCYMLLWDKPFFELAYCLVSTPEELIGWEQPDLHYVAHLPDNLRITRVIYERDAAKEAKLIEKCKAAQLYIEQQIQRINDAHKE